MNSVAVADIKKTVCDKNRCWQHGSVSEAGVTASRGSGWCYFLIEKHFRDTRCVGRDGKMSVMCDAVAVPLQASRKELAFLELKTSGKYSDAVNQIREGVRALLSYGVPAGVALIAEIWHTREPKSTVRTGTFIEVEGRSVFVRQRKSV